jgi:flagellar biogenesis protein FliO
MNELQRIKQLAGIVEGHKAGIVSCSSCGNTFKIANRKDGFSHCKDHTDYTPLINEDEESDQDADTDARSAAYAKFDASQQGVAEGSDVTDYNPTSQGGTRKELLAKYHKTKDPKDAEAARRAGATQKELQGVDESDEPDMKTKLRKTLDPAKINALEKLPLDVVKERAAGMIDSSTTTPQKKQYLLSQLDRCTSTTKVIKLLYDMLLAGEGNRVQGSTYSKKFSEESDEPKMKTKLRNTLDPAKINALEKLPLDVVKERAASMIDSSTTTPQKKQYLLSQLDRCTSTTKVIKLLYDMLLAGEGNRVQGSTYSKKFSEESDLVEVSMYDDSDMYEAYDINNGYYDVHHADKDDYFPDGADSPVIDKVGPSGARQGDNPEQKKMQIAETYKSLVYEYKKFLKESSGK